MRGNLKRFATLLVLAGLLVSCTKKEAPEPPQKEPTEKIRQWNDYVDPNGYPPRIDTTLIKGG